MRINSIFDVMIDLLPVGFLMVVAACKSDMNTKINLWMFCISMILLEISKILVEGFQGILQLIE